MTMMLDNLKFMFDEGKSEAIRQEPQEKKASNFPLESKEAGGQFFDELPTDVDTKAKIARTMQELYDLFDEPLPEKIDPAVDEIWLRDTEPMTLEAVSKFYEVTGERIRQIESGALLKVTIHPDALIAFRDILTEMQQARYKE